MKPKISAGINVESRDNIDRVAAEGLSYISIAAAILGFFFTWLQFRDIPIAELVQKTNGQYVQRVLLVIYYFCWIAGTTFDIHMQKSVYLVDPHGKNKHFSSVLTVVILVVVAAALLATKDNPFWFSAALSMFFTVNIAAWIHIQQRVLPLIQSSRRKYNEYADFIGLEKLLVVADYIVGKWQWYRFAAIGLVLLCLDAVALSKGLSADAAYLLNLAAPALPEQFIETILPQLFFSTFIVIAEGWIWWKRLFVRLSLNAFEHIGNGYALSPLPD